MGSRRTRGDRPKRETPRDYEFLKKKEKNKKLFIWLEGCEEPAF